MARKIISRWRLLLIPVVITFLALVPFDWFLGQYKYLGSVIGLSTIVTVGLCLFMGYTGQVSLGQAAFYGIGMYFSAVLSSVHGLNPWLAMLIAACVTGLVALLLGIILRLKGNYLAMATLAVGFIIWKIAVIDDMGYTGGPDGIRDIPYLAIGGFEFDSHFRRYYLVWGFCLVMLLISQFIVNSRIGRALRAVHGSEEAAESLGINVFRFKLKIFMVSAVYASIAGSLFAHHQLHVSPGYFDPIDSVYFVVMAVIGGLASIWGAIFGAGAVEILRNEILIHYDKWNMVILGLILMVILIFMPEGLFVALKNGYQQEGIFFIPKRLWRVVYYLYIRVKGLRQRWSTGVLQEETEP